MGHDRWHAALILKAHKLWLLLHINTDKVVIRGRVAGWQELVMRHRYWLFLLKSWDRALFDFGSHRFVWHKILLGAPQCLLKILRCRCTNGDIMLWQMREILLIWVWLAHLLLLLIHIIKGCKRSAARTKHLSMWLRVVVIGIMLWSLIHHGHIITVIILFVLSGWSFTLVLINQCLMAARIRVIYTCLACSRGINYMSR